VAGGARREPRREQARRVALVGHDGALRQEGPEGAGDGLGGQRPGGNVRPIGGLAGGGVLGGAHQLGERLERPGGVAARRRQHVHVAAVRHQVAVLARVREEAHRCLGIDHHQVTEAVELDAGELGQVRQAVDGR
jgi:hypothetical protein